MFLPEDDKHSGDRDKQTDHLGEGSDGHKTESGDDKSMSVASLVKELDSAGDLPAGFGDLLRKVPRELFIPNQVWVDGEHGDEAIDRENDSARWFRAAYSDTAVVTQFDDGRTKWPDIGRRPTCSASAPRQSWRCCRPYVSAGATRCWSEHDAGRAGVDRAPVRCASIVGCGRNGVSVVARQGTAVEVDPWTITPDRQTVTFV